MEAQHVFNARKNRLLEELPLDDAASNALMTRCAACLVILVVGVVTFDQDAQTRYPDRAAAWSHGATVVPHSSSRFQAGRARVALAPGRVDARLPATHEAASMDALPTRAEDAQASFPARWGASEHLSARAEPL